ncbi:hypothetical protein N803_14130 [Knoellia subterranea KCTC 19937]|uniref:Uncharacterized protein n=1 Tax=Knoellia subterranea KCTC 19937 TaxID=1385521 RepID=A0A0A0JPS7_9MICO|nr:hypothetical protein N803_14130 [Knoellia subterranea KCTC 19937]
MTAPTTEPTTTAVVPPLDPELAPVPPAIRQVLRPITSDTLADVRLPLVVIVSEACSNRSVDRCQPARGRTLGRALFEDVTDV